jgi:plasmid stabilization system protein ParE
MHVQWHRRALTELQDAADYYENEREGLGDEFVDEVERAIEQVKAFPNAWPRMTPKSRRIRTRRFPYGIVYQPHADRITLLAVMHLHRRPDYWRDREE